LFDSKPPEPVTPIKEATLEEQIKSITAINGEKEDQTMPLSLNNPVMKAALSHPYFNPAFTQQYYQQEELYKKQ